MHPGSEQLSNKSLFAFYMLALLGYPCGRGSSFICSHYLFHILLGKPLSGEITSYQKRRPLSRLDGMNFFVASQETLVKVVGW